MRKVLLGLAVPMLLLGGCQMKVGKDDSGNDAASIKIGDDGNVAISAKDGVDGVAISVPGFDGKMRIPGLKLGGDNMDIDGMKLYPGSTLHGINVTDSKGEGNGQVDMRFTSPAAPDKVAAYYADAARSNGFTDVNVVNTDGKATMNATKSDGDAVTITMEPAGTSTEGRIMIKDGSKG